MATPAIRIYDALKPALGEETAKEFIEALDESIVAKINVMKNDLATKGDIGGLKEDINALRLETKSEFAAVREEINVLRLETKSEFAAVREEISALRLETKVDIAALRLETRSNIAAVKDEIGTLRLATQNELAGLNVKMEKQHAAFLKHSYLIGVVQVIIILGALFGLVQALR